ncbi:twin-arginine translocation signal domain-containing protein [Flectobacillus rivi]|uniref:Twin-arginine translocation signal domain-containing protein n=1 Tax=Flectobacillus rivi TaxID=2984209 RepID=A0ABT6YW33_9BACT|nr:twin-arginine translocation signal domain-containing protein [Flectobacillus rivi]MDI9873028.1 twin-arginine translocation signal domain-containing protein [Flectobacillus rivi]
MNYNRRNFLKNTGMTAAVGVLATAKQPALAHTKPDDLTIGHNNFRYKVDKGWAKLTVNRTPLFNCHEMIQDQKGRLIMVGDHVANNILIFDKSGKLLDSWTLAFPGAHGLSLSKEGSEDFLIITDCGWYQDRNGQWNRQAGQVIKTDTNGRLMFAIGHPRTIGIYKDDEPFMPTETAVAPNGDIYVADGYGSDYIIQYDSKGKYIRHFGGKHNANPEHNLVNAHGVSIDLRDPRNPKVVCSSREENCFKFFTLEGKYLYKVDLPGMYVCRAVFHQENLYAGVCWSKDKEGKQNWGDSGFVTILDKNNKVVSNPGGNAPVYQNGVLLPTLATSNPIFNHGHDVCIDEDENIYVCQWNANHTAPIKLTRTV